MSDQAINWGAVGQNLDTYLSSITPFGFSGAILAAKGDEVLINQGYGLAIRDNGQPNTNNTVFSLGSLTKQFTAAAILKLEMEGKLAVTDPVEKFFPNSPKDKSQITIHQLLTHTAGIINYTGDDYEMAGRDETVQKIMDSPLVIAPGNRYKYSNAGYSLLAAILEKMSGEDYERYLRSRFFDPVGMQFTGYILPDWNKRTVAHWYVGETDNGSPLNKPYPSWNLIGNGDMLSTTEDMLLWHKALLKTEVLSPEALRKFYQPELQNYAYGWEVYESSHGLLARHGGASSLGSSAEFDRYLDENIVIMLFCNQAYSGSPSMAKLLAPKVQTIVFGGELILPEKVTPVQSDKLKKYTGTYWLAEGSILKVSIDNNVLVISAVGQEGLNILGFPDIADHSHLHNLNEQTHRIFQAAIAGDFSPLEKVTSSKERRLPALKELIGGRAGEIEAQSVQVYGTLPSSVVEDALDTYIELEGLKDKAVFIYIWKEDMNVGVVELDIDSVQMMKVIFQPVTKTEFVGYQLSAGKPVRIAFNISLENEVTGLEVMTMNPKKSRKV